MILALSLSPETMTLVLLYINTALYHNVNGSNNKLKSCLSVELTLHMFGKHSSSVDYFCDLCVFFQGRRLIHHITEFKSGSSIDCDDVNCINKESSVEENENFQLCEDFFISNLLYHTFLEPREKVIFNYYVIAARVPKLWENGMIMGVYLMR